MVASAKEKADPGCFKDVLSHLQTANGVPYFDLGDVGLPNFFPIPSSPGELHDNYSEISHPLSCGVTGVSTSSGVSGGSGFVGVAGGSGSVGVTVGCGSDVVAGGSSSSGGSSGLTSGETATSSTSGCKGVDDKKINERSCAIQIVRKKTAPKVTTSNLETLYRGGHVLFENSDGNSQAQCFNLLQGNSSLLNLALSKVKTKDFRNIKGNSNN